MFDFSNGDFFLKLRNLIIYLDRKFLLLNNRIHCQGIEASFSQRLAHYVVAGIRIIGLVLVGALLLSVFSACRIAMSTGFIRCLSSSMADVNLTRLNYLSDPREFANLRSVTFSAYADAS